METIGAVFKFLLVVLEAILIFNLLIVVHELGHFLAARWRGLVVERFGIWFGKPLWKKTIDGVQYSLGSIPFGGFVALPQLAPMDMIEGETTSDRARLPAVSPWDKIIVALAGPVFSLGLAALFAVLIYFVGRPVSEAEKSTVVGYVEPNSPAASARCDTPGVPDGLRPGDRMLEVDDRPVSRFIGMNGSVVWNIVRSEGETIPFKVMRPEDGSGQTLTFRAKPLEPAATNGWWRRKSLRQVLLEPAYSSTVAKVEPGSLAEKAGLRENDEVTAIDGQRLYSPSGFAEALGGGKYGQSAMLTVKRGASSLQLPLPPMLLAVGEVIKDGPADRAGIKKGDLVVTIAGVPPERFSDFSKAVLAHRDQAFDITVQRDGRDVPLSVTPQVPVGGKNPLVGITWRSEGLDWHGGGKMELVQESPLDQLRDSVTNIANTVSAVFAPKSRIGVQQLGGPLFIGRTYFYLLSSEQGWRLALWFSVVLNVNLALLNLLPIPVLDGGHILLALIEAARRRPVNIRVLEFVQTACFLLIAGYMLYVSFFDVGDLAGGRKELVFPSPPPVAAPSR